MPENYPYYVNNGDLVIADAKVSDKRPVHNTLLSYAEHGRDWDARCTSYFEE